MDRVLRMFVYDSMLSLVAYWTASGAVIAALTSFYEIPLTVSNLLTSLTQPLMCLQMVGGLLYGRVRSRAGFVKSTNLFWRLLVPVIFFSVLLPRPAGAWVMVVSQLAMVALFQLSNAAQTDWMIEKVEDRASASYYSIREMAFMLLYTVMYCVVTLQVDRAQRAGAVQQGFVTIGALQAGLAVLSVVTLLCLPGPSNRPREQAMSVRKLGAAVLRDKPYLRILAVNVIWTISNMFIGSFSSVYMVRTLQLDFRSIMIWTTLGSICRTALSYFICKLARRIGWKGTLQLSVLSMALAALGWFFITKQNMHALYPFLPTLASIPNAGFGVGVLTIQIDATPANERAAYFSLIATLNGLGAMLGSALCSLAIGVLETGVAGPDGLRYIFLIGLAGMGATALCVRRLILIRPRP